MNRSLARVAVPAGAALVALLMAIDVARQLERGVADSGLASFATATYVALVAAMAVGWAGRRRMALLMLVWLLVGVVSDLSVDWPSSRTLGTLSLLATGLASVTYAHMVLAYPSGRVRDRLDRWFVAGLYPLGLAWMAFPLLFWDPHGCAGCAPNVPSLFFTGITFDLTPVGQTFDGLFIALGLTFVALVVRRLRQSPPGAWPVMFPLAVAAGFSVAQFVLVRAVNLGGWSGLDSPLNVVGNITTLTVPVAIFVGIVIIRQRRGPVGDLVVELGSARPGRVETALARTLGDPSLELALWLPDEHRFVDEQGNRIDRPTAAPGRAITWIGPEGEPVAALVHDERLLGQRPLLEAAGTAARLALENTRLQAELRAQLAELRNSRRRIVSASDAERQRLERDLHDGAQQRLLALGLALQLLRDRQGDPELLAQAETELQAALRELRDLARGIHPAILTEHGLAPAIRSLADRTPVPTTIEAADDRYPPPVESAAYFLVSEALTNITKHAHAHSASVSLARHNGCLIIDITDDGCGGANNSGSGLQGLADRVGALDGRLTITSPSGTGTTIHAEIPCASS
jgi:signal transduction histidine kinase